LSCSPSLMPSSKRLLMRPTSDFYAISPPMGLLRAKVILDPAIWTCRGFGGTLLNAVRPVSWIRP
jgi:hypothetical protein